MENNHIAIGARNVGVAMNFLNKCEIAFREETHKEKSDEID